MNARVRLCMLGLFAMLVSAGQAGAQGSQGARAKAGAAARGGCPAPDTSATWYKRQREWLDESKAKWSDDALRTSLLKTGEMGGNGAMLGYEVVGAASGAISAGDSVLIVSLKKLAAERGSIWPMRSVVGARGVLAVWSLASKDTTLARASLKRMMEAGPDESPPAAVAIMEDRLRVKVGRKQLYGTQFQRNAAGKLEPLPIEDEAHLALRRDGAELPPLAQSVCAANSASRP